MLLKQAVILEHCVNCDRLKTDRMGEAVGSSKGPVTQRQRCNNSAMTRAILFSLKTMESLQIGVASPNLQRLYCPRPQTKFRAWTYFQNRLSLCSWGKGCLPRGGVCLQEESA